jgi:quinone-reactive Ni/Fe-hydrogenase large subunit
MLIGYANRSATIRPAMERFMGLTGMELMDFSTTVGRNAARAIEAKLCADFLFAFVSDLMENIKYYDEATWSKYDFSTLPTAASGAGIYEVPRGVLGHFVRIEKQKIANYQAVVPTTWNASPKDANNQRGPYEEALIGIRLADPEAPLEVLRVVHSFDPCIACAVHVIDAQGKHLSEYRVKTACTL